MKTIFDFKNFKEQQQKISMVTCYDYWSAQLINKSDVDCILVGDSAAMIMHGYKTTLNASLDLMADHTQAVCKGAPDKFIIADLPFMSYRKSKTDNMTAVEQLMKAGAHAVKLEGEKGNSELITHIVDSGVPVMGHIGLTPQSFHQLGGFKVQGKDSKSEQALCQQALNLEAAGCFSLVLECIPTHLAKTISEKLTIPTIGIGAGPYTDGQVLVLQDLLGMNESFKAKFVRTYLNGAELIKQSLNQFNQEVKEKTFPDPDKESY